MSLTWKDAVATLFMAAIVAVYVAFLNGTSLWLTSSARGTTCAVLVLGMVGGCALGAAGQLYAGTQSQPQDPFTILATMAGMAALVAAVIGLITGGTVALAALVATTLALWLIATMRHALTARSEPPSGREVHGVIHPDMAPH
jgi:hypothetical protein